jgi:N-acyl homoserine lactone hydrolase
MRFWTSAALLFSALSAPLALAQSKPSVNSVRLYVLDGGNLHSRDPKPLLDRGVKITDMSVASYLIVHPKGTLMWDTGVIPDEMIKPGGTTELRATVYKTVRGQLSEIGYKPADVTYLALSHNHYDHSANANEFAGSTWLVQRDERAAMFPDKPPANAPAIDPATTVDAAPRYAKLKTAKTKILDGDYDVFGDGTVMIIATPGHTPGHQSLYLKLGKTGPIVLSGDLYHYPAERTLKDFTPFANLGNPQQEIVSKAKMEKLLKDKKATLWIQHDLTAFKTIKKSPSYYE